MKFYTEQHKFYCGIDLHARKMYLCVMNQEGDVLLHKNMQSRPDTFLKAIKPYREDVVVCVECMFTWYWIADLCNDENITFVLGHALYMKAIHGGKVKNDKIDSEKIARMLKGGMLPKAYVYPNKMRATRDLLRRRNKFKNKRAELLTHIQNMNTQCNLSGFSKTIKYKSNRDGVEDRFTDLSVRKNIEADLILVERYDSLIRDLELFLVNNARQHDPYSFHLLQTVPGIGKIIALVLLYEVHDINRFPQVQDFSSYSRLVKPKHESNGKISGAKNSKIGNAHLKWAFSEAAIRFIGKSEEGKQYVERMEKKHGKGKALSIFAHKIGRAVYYILKNKEPFNQDKFFNRA